MRERVIVAMGGGGFSMEPANLALDDFVLAASGTDRPRICFLPTASADAATYIVKFYRAFTTRACVPTDLTLTEGVLARQPASTSEIRAFLARQDIVYVGGGNTANLLALWRTHGIDQALRDAWQAGTVLCGVSAGMLCWFSAGVTDSWGELGALNDGLGLLDGSACPHYDGEPLRRPRYRELVAGGFPGGYAADDGAALVFRGEALDEVVTSRPGACAYRVDLVDGEVVERSLPTRFLGASARERH